MAEFVDAILRFKDKAMDNADLVVKYATQELAFDMTRPVAAGGRMRVDTGFLRASFRITLDNPVLQSISKPDGVGAYSFDEGAIGLTINGFQMGQTIFMTFTANYARPREYGARGQPPDAFVRTHTADWQGYVNRAAQQLANR